MKKMINLKINNIPVTVPEGTTVLQAAKHANIEIPSLCYLKDVNCIGACRVCVVEIKGRRGLTAACTCPQIQKDDPRADPLHTPQEMSLLREGKSLRAAEAGL